MSTTASGENEAWLKNKPQAKDNGDVPTMNPACPGGTFVFLTSGRRSIAGQCGKLSSRNFKILTATINRFTRRGFETLCPDITAARTDDHTRE
ncbi:hypothetical protein RRG08_011520 [Elysia crispata]|uniref:Uncharacterized protein n=1 Tax=Elysia crispata TaxID=231223 RepID=A0AAE1AUH4_9GAST|nr:hypothetical protein RRG08_011520 [Elysia crispata]